MGFIHHLSNYSRFRIYVKWFESSRLLFHCGKIDTSLVCVKIVVLINFWVVLDLSSAGSFICKPKISQSNLNGLCCNWCKKNLDLKLKNWCSSFFLFLRIVFCTDKRLYCVHFNLFVDVEIVNLDDQLFDCFIQIFFDLSCVKYFSTSLVLKFCARRWKKELLLPIFELSNEKTMNFCLIFWVNSLFRLSIGQIAVIWRQSTIYCFADCWSISDCF